MATNAAAIAEAAQVQQQVESCSNGKGSNTTAPSFQEAIKRLQDYWASVGCIVWLPHNTEVGAGTMNPATFLRYDPCRQPSIRNAHSQLCAFSRHTVDAPGAASWLHMERGNERKRVAEGCKQMGQLG
jgi:hypothetical protein